MPEPVDTWVSGGITYKSFFHLSAKPFDLLPNPEFLFLSRSHKRALSYLDYGIRERVGFILLTGEVGSGKTTIIRDLIKKHLDNVILSKIFNTRVGSEQLIAMINEDFGLCVKNKDKITLLRDLNEFLIDQYTKGTRPVLIIDEAQNLASELLEEIRMLSNLETDSSKLLQIILVGQPELRTTLSAPEMVQLRQRISINCHLRPLTIPETEQYILHRLEKAGNRDAVTFQPEALHIIFRYSRGIPRLINIICDFLLLSAFAVETQIIDKEMVKDIIEDLDFEQHFWGTEPPPTSMSMDSGGLVADETALCRDDLTAMISEISEISEITQRLDRLGKASADPEPDHYQAITEKILAVEQGVKTYREETSELLSELRKTLVPAKTETPEGSAVEKDRSAKPGFFRNFFGYLGPR